MSEPRVLICGSRTWTDRRAIGKRMMALPNGTRIIHGAAGGADSIAGLFASALGLPLSIYLAQWKVHGNAAGPVRNQRMLDEGRPTLVIAFWDGKSRGTKDMLERAHRAGVQTEIIGPSEEQ
jgi:hypothetical protein